MYLTLANLLDKINRLIFIFLSCIIVFLYVSSIVLYEKKPKIFFCTGLISLCMLFTIEFSKFEFWGRFTISNIAPYIAFFILAVNIIYYVYIKKDNFGN